MKQNLHSSVWKCWLLSLFVFSFYLPSYSQYTGENGAFYEAGISLGPSNFLGDLGGTQGIGRPFLKDNNFPLTQFMIGAYLTYQPSEWLGFRLMGNYGHIQGDDGVIKGKGGEEENRKVRNQNFKSDIAEAFLALEIYPTVFLEYEPTDIFHKLRPYGVIGVGVFHFNPMGTDPANGNWVYLRPLHTEGEGFPEYPDRKEYKLTQLNIPMGVGVKYFLSESVSLSLEVIHRKTFTDYLDDVSTTYVDPAVFYAHLPLAQAQLAQRMANKSLSNGVTNTYGPGDKRGTATNNDAYYSFGFKLGIRLGSGNRWSNSTRCPVHF